jgi:Winged helix DNA-binding domain
VSGDGPTVTWPQALAWRMQRHYLDPVGAASAVEIVRRLCGVQAQVASSADQAVRVRQQNAVAGAVAKALADGRLVKTWAMRGTLHLLAPEDSGDYLALMAHGRWWETPRWQRYFGVSAAQMEKLREVVRDTLGKDSMTREELVAAVTRRRGFGHVGDALRSGWGTILKPLAWQGDIVFGPSRGTRVTFMQPAVASAAWAGVPSVQEAAPRAILAYLGAYGPATIDNFSAWLSRGTIAKRELRSWFADLGDRIAEVDVGGEPRYVRTDDVGDLLTARPTDALRLLPGFDQWVLGPGTDDSNVLPAAHRRAVSRQSGWIAPIVVAGGVVAGTWEAAKGRVTVSWFAGTGHVPRGALAREMRRLSPVLGDVELEVVSAP